MTGRTILGTAAGLGSLFTGVLMILLFAPEFSWRTARQNVIDGLSKERFYAGKVILLARLVLILMATTLGAAVRRSAPVRATLVSSGRATSAT
jgi:hypothetical protein